MASIYERKSKKTKRITYYIIYRIKIDGKPVKKQFKCEDKKQALILLPEVKKAESENREFTKYQISTAYSNSKAITVNQLIHEYINNASTGYNTKRKPWSPSTRSANLALTKNYITPYIGDEKITAITPQYLKSYIDDLLKQDRVNGNHTSPQGKVTARIVEDILKILRPAFKLGVVFYGLPYNPVREISAPHTESAKTMQWNLDDLKTAINLCSDEQMKTMMILMTSCTLRSCELCGLTWDCVNISDQAQQSNMCYIDVEKDAVRLKDIDVQNTNTKTFLRFPKKRPNTTTSIYLKEPKTPSSIRRIYISTNTVQTLKAHYLSQQRIIQTHGNKYQSFNLVFAHDDGSPYVSSALGKEFNKFLKRINHPNPVDFNSLRHTGITLKLKTTTNLKAVQGDSGHSTMDMIEKHYWGLHQEDRIDIAKKVDDILFEDLNDSYDKNSEDQDEGLDETI